MEEKVTPHYTVPKMAPYLGIGDPKDHLKTFKAQMLIAGGSNAVRCKMFMGNFMEQHFSGLVESHMPLLSRLTRSRSYFFNNLMLI